MQPRLIRFIATLGLVATLGLGCLPPANDAGELVSSSSDGADAQTDPGTASSTSGVDSGSGSGPGSETGSTTAAELDDPCLVFPAEACPAECTLVPTYTKAASLCDVDFGSLVYTCVSTGGSIGGAPTTFYGEIDGEVRYAVHGQPCTESTDRVPVALTECSGAPDEPELCQCLCGSQGCPYEADLLELEACDLPKPCGELVINDTDMASDYDLCVLAALRDRIPGAYASHRIGLFGDESHVYLFGGQDAQLLHVYGSDLCSSAVPAWDPTRTCTLRPPEWFDACMTDVALQPDCLFGESWFDGCVEQPASCG